MHYVCLIYGDPKVVFNNSPESNALLDAVGPHNAELKQNGTLVSGQPLSLPSEAVTVRVQNGTMSTTDGPFMETREVLGGFCVIDARDMNDALRIAAAMPHAKLGCIEVRPMIDFSKPRPIL